MAVKKIGHKELFEGDLTKKQIGELQALLKLSEQVEQQFKDILKVQQKALKGKEGNSSANLKRQAEAVEKVKQAEKGLNDISKVRIQTQSTYFKSIDKLNKQREKEATLSKKQAASAEKQALKIRALQAPYKKLSDRLLLATKAYQNVAAAEGVASTKAIKYKKALDRLDKRLKTIDANAGRFQRNIGNYAKGMQNLSNIALAAGGTLGLAGVFNVFKEGIGTMREFEQANANLAAVLGKSRQEIKPLTDSAMELGSITEWSATQVISLQDSYSRLGFSQDEILKVQAATLQGATALQGELGATAELTGGTLRAFGEDSSQAQRFVDVLAKSTSTSALNFEKLSTSLPIVGKTAQVAGVSFERTAAQLGVLANNNIDASTSGSALRNIYLDLAKKGLTYEQAMNKINGSTNKLAEANELFGKRGAAVALTLAQSTDAVNELEDAYENAGGTAKKMADEQLKTLEGSIKLLKSAWEGFILSLNQGDKVTGKLAKAVKWLAENLNDVLKTIWAVVKVFIVYKTTMFAIAKAQKLAALATTLYTLATSKATKATKLFNKASKANIIGAVITLLFAAYEAFQFFTKGAEEATEAQTALNDELERNLELNNKARTIRERLLTLGTQNKRLVEDLKNDIISQIQAEEDLIAEEQKNAAVNEKINSQKLKRIDNEIAALRKQRDAEEDLAEQQILNARIEVKQTSKEFIKGTFQVSERTDRVEELNTALVKVNKRLKEFNKESKSTTLSEKELEKIRKNQARIDAINSEIRGNRIEREIRADIDELKRIDDQAKRIQKKNEEIASAKITAEIEADIKAQEELKKREEQRQKDAIATARLITDELDKELQKQFDKKQELLDKEIAQSKKHQEELKELARNGVEDAADNLAFEQKKQAELELQKAEQERKLQQAQFFTDFVKVYLANAENDPNSALAKTTKDMLALKATAKTLSSLDVGSEDMTDVNQSYQANDGKGGFFAINHPGERMLTPSQNSMTKGISNDKLAQLGKEYKESGNSFNSNAEVLRKFDSLESAVKNIETTSFDFNKLSGMVETIVESRNRKLTLHSKPGSLFRK